MQYYISMRCTTLWFIILILYEIFATRSLVTVGHHTEFCNIIDYIPYAIHYYTTTYLVCKWEFVPLNSWHIFHQFPHIPDLWNPLDFFFSWDYFSWACLFFIFRIYIYLKPYSICCLFSMIPWSSIHVVSNGKILVFLWLSSTP